MSRRLWAPSGPQALGLMRGRLGSQRSRSAGVGRRVVEAGAPKTGQPLEHRGGSSPRWAECGPGWPPLGSVPPPAPRREGSRPALPGGKGAVQVIRFKLKIIKITIQNKKKTISNKPGTSPPCDPCEKRGASHHLGGSEGLAGGAGGAAG